MDSGIVVVLVIIFIIICVWFYRKLQLERKRSERLAQDIAKLTKDNSLLKAEHLKFQLQPHTINNILANLKAISNKLNRGMESLSETLDYVLYKGNHQFVSIEDELDFIKKYLALNDLFISGIDSIKVDHSGINYNSRFYSARCLPHLITATFIENAFKHGDIHHPEFLKIHLTLSESHFEMKVINRIKTRPNLEKGGIGLNNMKQRLDILVPGKHQVSHQCNEESYHSNLTIHF